ncbi:MAG: TolC family protein [Candidatus Kapaibacterium sp.]
MYNATKRILLFFIISIPLCLNAQESSQELSLKDLVNKALQNNQSIKSSVLDETIADKRVSEVKSNMLPQININGDYKYYSQMPLQLVPSSTLGGPENVYIPFEFGTPWNLSTTISAGQLIYSQQYINGIKMANTGKDLSHFLVRKSKEDIVYNVSTLYYNAQIISANIGFIRSNIVNMEKLISTGELLFENQMIKNTDVEKLKLNKTMLETQENTINVTYDELINMLKFLSGFPQSDKLSISKDISTKIDIQPLRLSKPERIEVKLLEKQKELNELERKNLIAGYLPSLYAYGVYNYTFYGKGGGADLFKGYPASWFGLQLSWNIFDGLGRKTKIDQKNVENMKLDLQLNQINENISMELSNAKNQINLQESNIQSRKDQLSLAEKIYGQVRQQFNEGLINITEVLQSDNSLREAQNNYLVSLINLLNAQLSWKKAAGKLLNY